MGNENQTLNDVKNLQPSSNLNIEKGKWRTEKNTEYLKKTKKD